MKIRGNTVGTTMPRTNFNERDEKKASCLRNNPFPEITDEDEGKFLTVSGGKYALTELADAEEVSI